MRRTAYRNPAQRLRSTVEALPDATKEAMLQGISRNRIIVGAYVDPRSGGICPMLAAHRNGGRTSLASFARAWDSYTGAKRPRLARRREVATLVSLLESSLAAESLGSVATGSLSEVAQTIRTERAALAERAARERVPSFQPPEPVGDEPMVRRISPRIDGPGAGVLRARLRWAWMKPARRNDEFKDLLAAAEEQLSEARAADELGSHDSPLVEQTR